MEEGRGCAGRRRGCYDSEEKRVYSELCCTLVSHLWWFSIHIKMRPVEGLCIRCIANCVFGALGRKTYNMVFFKTKQAYHPFDWYTTHSIHAPFFWRTSWNIHIRVVRVVLFPKKCIRHVLFCTELRDVWYFCCQKVGVLKNCWSDAENLFFV